MEVNGRERIASVELLDVRASEDELTVCEAALSHMLDAFGAAEIEQRLGATRDEVEALRDDLRRALARRETPTLA
jgi:uncharacterized small protein (DUF1192 family)